MTRRAALILFAVLVLAATAAPGVAKQARGGGARLQGTFTMHGRLTSVDNVRGEHGGQRVTRRWRFVSRCRRGACAKVILYRERDRRATDVVTLHRRRANVYAGTGQFYVPLSCAGRAYRRGGLAAEIITVRITRAEAVQTKRFATAITAVYRNPARYNGTLCSGFLGHDGARYSGRATAAPGPPTADFSAAPNVATQSAAFSDASRRGSSGAPIRAWRWSFGDPASGSANSSSAANPSHTFSAHGTYAVTLTVTDANGLTASASHPVTV